MNDIQIFIASNARKWSWYDGSGVYVARAVFESRAKYKKDPEFHFWHYPWKGDRYGNPTHLVLERHTSDLSAMLRLVPLCNVPLEQAFEHLGIKREIVDGRPPHLAYSTRSNSLSWHHYRDNVLYVVHIGRNRRTGAHMGISAKPLDLSKRWHTVFKRYTESYREVFDDYTYACFSVDAYLMATAL